jgi:hypothetical protein
MIVMGGIVGSGIFINPYVVAERVHTPALILGVWLAGGLLALGGAFIWAELATRLPGAGGQYLYLREAYHPSVAFVYGWVLLLVTQTGGMAGVAVTFAHYFREVTAVNVDDRVVAAIALLGLTAINCFGARAGSNVQTTLMLLKSAAIATLVIAGLSHGGTIHFFPLTGSTGVLQFGALDRRGDDSGSVCLRRLADRELRRGRNEGSARDLSRGLIAGCIGVVVLYLAVNFVCVLVLGPEGLAATKDARFGDYANRDGRNRRATDRHRHRGFDVGIPEPGNSHCAARVQPHGAGRIVLPSRRLDLAAHGRAGGRDRAARRAGRDHRNLRALRSNSELRRVGRLHIVRIHRGGLDYLATTRAFERRRRVVSHPGTSLHDRVICLACAAIVIATIRDSARRIAQSDWGSC